jgi:acylphosphatase
MLIRIHAIYRGRVHGVFFRATAQEIARDLAVSGTIRNLDDGSVELEAQGEPEPVQSLLDRIAQRYNTHIQEVLTRQIALRGDERGFRITHG